MGGLTLRAARQVAAEAPRGDAMFRVLGRLRAARGRPPADHDLTNGPAKLTQALALDGTFNGADLVLGEVLWLEEGEAIPDEQVMCGPRIGIQYAAQKDREVPWRFWIRGNPYVSGRTRR